MKRLLSLLAVLSSAFFLVSATGPYEDYVARYGDLAVREMYRSGVPASITLAQGLLESGAGLSRLASEGNNHFGIKCHRSWTGKTIRADDDLKNECFRAYADAEESFRDHSDFLRYSDRYKFLFDFKTTDYKSWAYGLKKAGYATDPSYPAKLIKMVEDYDLSRFDRMKPEEKVAPAETPSGRKEKASHAKKAKKEKEKKEKVGQADRPSPSPVPSPEEEVLRIPDSPLKIEEPEPLAAAQMEEYRFPLSRQLYSRNGVPFVYSVEGETYSSIAETYHLFRGEILRFNDLQYERRLLPGTVVYLQAKKKSAARGLDKYIVGQDGESLRDICQRFGVRMSSVRKMNALGPDDLLHEGDDLVLRQESLVRRVIRKRKK